MFYLACNDRRHKCWSCQNVCDALSYLSDKIYIKFGTKLYRQIIGILMGSNDAPLVANFLLFGDRHFMTSFFF